MGITLTLALTLTLTLAIALTSHPRMQKCGPIPGHVPNCVHVPIVQACSLDPQRIVKAPLPRAELMLNLMPTLIRLISMSNVLFMNYTLRDPTCITTGKADAPAHSKPKPKRNPHSKPGFESHGYHFRNILSDEEGTSECSHTSARGFL